MPPKTDFISILKSHTDNEDARFDSIMSDIRFIKENHLTHIEADIQYLKTTGAGQTKDIEWIKWIVTVTLGAVMVGVIGAVLSLILKG